MQSRQSKTLFYKRSHFVTHFPVDFAYTASHAWVVELEAGFWQVGLTKFATRMLGELVDHGFDAPPGSRVKTGQIIGWIEGFKAISDLFCIGEGEFIASNPALQTRVNLVTDDPYGQGWLYQFKGQPDKRCVDVQAYSAILDETIDRMLEKGEESE